MRFLFVIFFFCAGAKKFDYGSVELAQLPLPKGRKDDSNGGWGKKKKKKIV
jgi:hypothetical protein